MDFSNLIMKEYLILIPFIYIIGMFLKTFNFHDNRLIPTTLAVIGIMTGMLISVAQDNPNKELMDLINGMIQGVFCAGMAVFGNQVLKCVKDYTDNNNDKKE